MEKRFRDLEGLLGASINPGARAGSLPVAQQQTLEIMRALVAQHRILIMDEPLRRSAQTNVDISTQARRTDTTPRGLNAAGGWGKELHCQPLDNFEDAFASAKTNGEASIHDEASVAALTVSDQT